MKLCVEAQVSADEGVFMFDDKSRTIRVLTMEKDVKEILDKPKKQGAQICVVMTEMDYFSKLENITNFSEIYRIDVQGEESKVKEEQLLHTYEPGFKNKSNFYDL